MKKDALTLADALLALEPLVSLVRDEWSPYPLSYVARTWADATPEQCAALDKVERVLTVRENPMSGR